MRSRQGAAGAIPLAFMLALSGCSAALSSSTSGGNAASTATTATQAHAAFGSAKLGASFGTPSAPPAPGGRISLGHGAAGVVILGLVIADLLHYFGSPSGSPGGAVDTGAISQTCSCYGYVSPARETAAAQDEQADASPIRAIP